MFGGILIDNQTKNLFRVGTVCNLNPDDQTVRVEFDDLGTTSNWMQIPSLGAEGDDYYWMPTVGEQVLCAFMPTGNAEGYVLRSIRGTDNAPAYPSKNKRYISFSDGGLLMYDKESSTLTINAANIVIKGAATLTGTLDATGDITAGGISLESHVHTDVTSGSDKTGEPE